MRLKPYLADGLSLLRAASFVPLAALAAAGKWEAALIVLLAAWATDLADGIAAHKFGSWSKTRSLDMDGIADSVLAFGASSIPVMYAYRHHSTLASTALTIVYAVTVVSAIAMVSIMNGPHTTTRRWAIAWNMIVMHGAVQIGATIVWFAYMASGMADILWTLSLLAMISYYQAHKVRLWWNGKFE